MKKFFILNLVFLMVATAACVPQATTVPTIAVNRTEPVNPSETATSAPTIPTHAVPSGGISPSLDAKPAFSNVVYAGASSAEKLDLYIPEGEGPFPLVILVHGGAFMMGDKAAGDATIGVDQLLSQGFAVASINYRLSGEANAPAQIQDIKTAVRFLRANAKDYQLNTEKIGAWGGSAGGSLVSLLGTSCGVNELEGPELGNAEQSSCVQAVVDWFGPIDFLQMDVQFTGTSCPANHDAANSPESQLVGGPIQENGEIVKLVNAETYISSDDPPFLIQHGTSDCNVPPQQSQHFYTALSSTIGVEKVTLTLLEGAGHGGSLFTTQENINQILDFLNLYLR
jgi:acetyl esterase/lipase